MNRIFLVYEQIVKHYIERIDSHDLNQGDSIESEEDIAAAFSVSRGTVRKAMLELESMGYLTCSIAPHRCRRGGNVCGGALPDGFVPRRADVVEPIGILGSNFKSGAVLCGNARLGSERILQRERRSRAGLHRKNQTGELRRGDRGAFPPPRRIVYEQLCAAERIGYPVCNDRSPARIAHVRCGICRRLFGSIPHYGTAV